MLRVSFEEVSALASEVNRGSEELNQVVGTLTSTFQQLQFLLGRQRS